MLLLAFDTATPAVTVALRGDEGVLAEHTEVDARRHGELLAPGIEKVLAEAGRSRTELTGVAVGVGPGPFTGLRVGLMTARALGDALEIPVHGVCTLDILAAAVTGRDAPFAVATDARRREVYWARYRDGVRIDGPAVSAPADVDPGVARAVAGSPEHAALFGLPLREPSYPTPAGLVAAVADWSERPAALVPLYLRRPDAKTLAERETSR